MLDKAVIIANEALQYLRSRFPADDKKYGEFHNACGEMVLRLNWLKDQMLEVHHEQKSKDNDPCTCPKCNQFAKEDADSLEQCLREAVRARADPRRANAYGGAGRDPALHVAAAGTHEVASHNRMGCTPCPPIILVPPRAGRSARAGVRRRRLRPAVPAPPDENRPVGQRRGIPSTSGRQCGTASESRLGRCFS